MRSRAVHSGGPAADVEFCLVLPRESLSIPVMRRVLGDTLTRLGVDQSSVTDLLLAVTEACTNVLLHAGPGRRYELVAHVNSRRCLVEVLDDGSGIDPARRRRACRPPPGGPAGAEDARPASRTDLAGLDRTRVADHPAQPDRPVATARQGACGRRPARVGPRICDHEGLR